MYVLIEAIDNAAPSTPLSNDTVLNDTPERYSSKLMKRRTYYINTERSMEGIIVLLVRLEVVEYSRPIFWMDTL